MSACSRPDVAPPALHFFSRAGHLRDPHSFPTRRSSDLGRTATLLRSASEERRQLAGILRDRIVELLADRKSTRLNSSHLVISYAVFCLKKKKRRTHNSLDGRSCVLTATTSSAYALLVSH